MRKSPVPVLALLLTVTPLLMGNVPMEVPPPIEMADFVDTTKVSKALLTALANRKWLVEADTGESITARFDIRRHSARIRLDYTPRRISFHYLDSQNLDHEIEDDTVLIHANFNKWLRQLEKEVQIQVQRFYFEREPMDVIPPSPSTPPLQPSGRSAAPTQAPAQPGA